MGIIKAKAGYLMILVIILLLAVTPIMSGCGEEEVNDEPTATPAAGFELSGTIDEAGSTSVQPLAELMAAEFTDLHPKVKVNISGGGSSSGVKACAAGTVDLGAASRDIKITEQDLIPYSIARDAVAIAVHTSNPVSELTVDQVADIYEGAITNWSEVGGNNEDIVVVSREEGSGTRDCFEHGVTKNIKDDALFYDSNGAVKTKVSSESKAIGFLSLGYVEGLKTITLDGVDPTPENCASGKYPVLRRLYVLTVAEAEDEVAAFINFCRSDEGQAIAEAEGYIPLNKLSMTYVPPTGKADVIAGTIDEAGSTSVQPLAELMAAEFMSMYPAVKINISGGGSSSGVKACAAGTVDLGAASRDIKITEQDLIPHCIARDAVAIAVHPSNPVSELTIDQVAGIYEGTITNWSEVGGNNEDIVVVSREEGSGTRDCFEHGVTKNIKDDALFYDSNGAVKTKVSSESKAIGFLSLGYVEGLKTITLDGVDPTPETCASGEYPVLRRLYLLTTEVPTDAVRAFLEFCRSEEGQVIAESEGYITLNL